MNRVALLATVSPLAIAFWHVHFFRVAANGLPAWHVTSPIADRHAR